MSFLRKCPLSERHEGSGPRRRKGGFRSSTFNEGDRKGYRFRRPKQSLGREEQVQLKIVNDLRSQNNKFLRRICHDSLSTMHVGSNKTRRAFQRLRDAHGVGSCGTHARLDSRSLHRAPGPLRPDAPTLGSALALGRGEGESGLALASAWRGGRERVGLRRKIQEDPQITFKTLILCGHSGRVAVYLVSGGRADPLLLGGLGPRIPRPSTEPCSRSLGSADASGPGPARAPGGRPHPTLGDGLRRPRQVRPNGRRLLHQSRGTGSSEEGLGPPPLWPTPSP